MSDPMQEIRASFFVECEELLEALQDGLQTMSEGEADAETINVVFRAVHSIKGGAGAFGLDQLVAFAHKFENALDAVRAGTLSVDDGLVLLFFKCGDILSDLVRASREDEPLDAAVTAPVVAELQAATGDSGEEAEEEIVDFTPMTLSLDLGEIDGLAGADDDMSDLAFGGDLPLPGELPPASAGDDGENNGAENGDGNGGGENDETIYRIVFSPEPELYGGGNEPLFLFRLIADLGSVETEVEASGTLPALDELGPQVAILTWTLTLRTRAGRAAVLEVFEFVEGLCGLEVEVVDTTADIAAEQLPGDGQVAGPGPEVDQGAAMAPAAAPGSGPLATGAVMPEATASNGSGTADPVSAALPPPDLPPPGLAPPDLPPPDLPSPGLTLPDLPGADLAPPDLPKPDLPPPGLAEPEAGASAATSAAPDLPEVPPEAPPEPPEGPVPFPPARAGETAASSAASSAKTAQKSPTVRVDLERIDRLVNLVGELVINQAMLAQSVTEAGLPTNSPVSSGLDEFQHLTRNIQESVMMIRAQPVKSLFQRMGRIVREASTAVGKDARLVTEGEATEIDKTVIERLSDPLTHMIRNAVDHGLESVEDRRAAGKPEKGTVTLTAAHRSGRVVIEVSDDGGGINRPRVQAIAEEKGLIAPGQAMSDHEIDNLLFMAGFSTAKEISNLSGRGVGMDVVRSSISALGGRIAIASTPGQGTSFSISLPLTLAVLDGMVVGIENETMVVPLNAIAETLMLTESDIRAVGPRTRVVLVRDSFVPLLDLGAELGYRAPRSDYAGSIALLIAQEDGSRAALVVDEIDDQRQVVIKGLQDSYGHVPGVAAATILGDGQIALILDPADLIANASGQSAPDPALQKAG